MSGVLQPHLEDLACETLRRAYEAAKGTRREEQCYVELQTAIQLVAMRRRSAR